MSYEVPIKDRLLLHGRHRQTHGGALLVWSSVAQRCQRGRVWLRLLGSRGGAGPTGRPPRGAVAAVAPWEAWDWLNHRSTRSGMDSENWAENRSFQHFCIEIGSASSEFISLEVEYCCSSTTTTHFTTFQLQ